MSPRPRRFAPGLRGRIVGAILITSMATLGIAAIGLLGPLEKSLRNAAQKTLEKDLGKHPLSQFKVLQLNDLAFRELWTPKVDDPQADAGHEAAKGLESHVNQLAIQIGGNVYFLGYPGAAGDNAVIICCQASGAPRPAGLDDVADAFRTHRRQDTFGTIDGKEYARIAIPFTTSDGVEYVLSVRRPIDEIPGAVHAVSRAFIYAAGAGLLLTILLGIPLAARLVRRLRRLRESALRIAHDGPPVEMPE